MTNKSPVVPFIYILIIGIFILFFGLLIRNTGLYPVVFSDEWRYSNLSRNISLDLASVPSYLFLLIFRFTNFCGEGYLNCARIINVILFIGAIPLIYDIAKTVTSKNIAVLIALLSGLSPFNTYTAYFMPESMNFFVFWSLTWTIFKFKPGRNSLFYTMVGIILGAMSLIKVHAIFLIPALVVFFIYRNWISGYSNWMMKTSIFLCYFLASFIAVKLILGFMFAGLNGITILGHEYGAITDSFKATGKLWGQVDKEIFCLQGHLMGLIFLFGVPFASYNSYWKCKKTSLVNNPLSDIRIYTATILIVLVILSVYFTSTIATSGTYETITRIHMRYYNFIFPLFLIITAGSMRETSGMGAFWLKLLVSVLIIIVTVLAIIFLPKMYDPGLVDCPELRGVTFNPKIFTFLGGLSVLTSIVWLFSSNQGNRIYFFIFLPISILVSSLFVTKELRMRIMPDVYDKAGIFTHNYLTSNQIAKTAIVGSEPGSLFRAAFYLDNPATRIVHIGKNAPVDLSLIPKGIEWILVIEDHKLPQGQHHELLMGGFSLLNMSTETHIYFNECCLPQIVRRIDGLSSPENFGSWSDKKNVSIELVDKLPRNFLLTIKANAFDS